MLEGVRGCQLGVTYSVRGVLGGASYLKSARVCGVTLDERNSIVTVYTVDLNTFFPVGNLTELVLFLFYT